MGFEQWVRAVRGAAANPRRVMGAFNAARASQKPDSKPREQQQRRRMDFGINQMLEEEAEKTKDMNLRRFLAERYEGAQVLMAPVMIPMRHKVIWPAKRLACRAYDTVNGARKSVRAAIKAARTPRATPAATQPSHTARPAGGGSSGAALSVVENTKRAVMDTTGTMSRAFKHLMLDPRFATRKAVFKLRQWEPDIGHAGRSMAPLALGGLLFMVVYGVGILVVTQARLNKEHGMDMRRREMAQRHDPVAFLGLPTEMKRKDDELSEDNALLETFMTKKY